MNSTPKLGTLANDLDSIPMESPPSPSLFGPNGPFERVTRQRGKVAIGVDDHGSSDTTIQASVLGDERSDDQSTLGQDSDGWFVVDFDGKRSSQILDSQPRVEFGQFNSPTPPLSSQPKGENRNGNTFSHRRGDGPRGSRDTRRGSVSESLNGNGPYRHTSQTYMGGNGGGNSRRGGASRGAGQRGHSRSGSGYGGNNNRSFSGPNFQQATPQMQSMRGYAPSPYEANDPYAYSMMGMDYTHYYVNPASAGVYPYSQYPSPYSGYPMPAFSPAGYGSQSSATAPPMGGAAPPIPTPVTQLPYQLDALRFWLLGQVRDMLYDDYLNPETYECCQIEYYFSMQNLATDVFLRRQVSTCCVPIYDSVTDHHYVHRWMAKAG